MNSPWLGSASPMVIPSVVQREQFLLAGSDPSTVVSDRALRTELK